MQGVLVAGSSTELDPGSVEERLVEEARRGSSQSFEQLYRRHVGQVHAVCRRMVGDPDLAATLTQDAFVRAWQKLGTYAGRGSFGGWLRRLAVNVVIEDRRRAARAAGIFSDDERAGRTAAAPARSAEDVMDLERAVAALPPGARMAVVLHDIEGYRHREIAAIAGVASGTVKAQLHRARSLLRQALQGGWKESPR